MASVTVAVEGSPSPLLSPSPLVTSEPEAVDNGLKLMFNLWINWGFGKTEGLLLLISENPLAFTITLFVLALSCLLWYCCSCCCCCLRRQPERRGINKYLVLEWVWFHNFENKNLLIFSLESKVEEVLTTSRSSMLRKRDLVRHLSRRVIRVGGVSETTPTKITCIYLFIFKIIFIFIILKSSPDFVN